MLPTTVLLFGAPVLGAAFNRDSLHQDGSETVHTGEAMQITGTSQLQWQFTEEMPRFPLADFTSCDPVKVDIYMREGLSYQGIRAPDGTRLATTHWTYTFDADPKPAPSTVYGPALITRRNCPITVNWVNDLPKEHRLPIDRTLHCGDNTINCTAPDGADTRTVVHLHGGFVDWQYDGNTEGWYTKGADPASAGKYFMGTEFTYKNDQEGCTLLYHDHALGITRLNVYMGLAGAYYILDSHIESLIAKYNVPTGEYFIPMVLKDVKYKMEDDKAELLYFTGTEDDDGNPLPENSILPEQFGDINSVNGMAWPKVTLPAAAHRLALVGGTDSRSYKLSFHGPNGVVPFLFFAAAQGVAQNAHTLTEVYFGHGERVEIILNLEGFLPGDIINCTNTQPTLQDTFDNETEGRVFQIVISNAPVTAPKLLLTNGASLRDIPYVPNLDITHGTPKVRQVTLNEIMEQTAPGGVRPQPQLGVWVPGKGTMPMLWDEPATEIVRAGETEIWEIINLTPDSHPIHIHLVSFRILNRQQFTRNAGNDQIILLGPVIDPAASEDGPVDVVNVPPGQMARVLVKWRLPAGKEAYTEQRFVWHCHILSHEDNEMMRPLEVIPGHYETFKLAPSFATDSAVLNFNPASPVILSYTPCADSVSPGHFVQAASVTFTPSTSGGIQKAVFKIRVALTEPGVQPVIWSSVVYYWTVTSWQKGVTQRSVDFSSACNDALDYRRSTQTVPVAVKDLASPAFEVEFTLISVIDVTPAGESDESIAKTGKHGKNGRSKKTTTTPPVVTGRLMAWQNCQLANVTDCKAPLVTEEILDANDDCNPREVETPGELPLCPNMPGYRCKCVDSYRSYRCEDCQLGLNTGLGGHADMADKRYPADKDHTDMADKHYPANKDHADLADKRYPANKDHADLADKRYPANKEHTVINMHDKHPGDPDGQTTHMGVHGVTLHSTTKNAGAVTVDNPFAKWDKNGVEDALVTLEKIKKGEATYQDYRKKMKVEAEAGVSSTKKILKLQRMPTDKGALLIQKGLVNKAAASAAIVTEK